MITEVTGRGGGQAEDELGGGTVERPCLSACSGQERDLIFTLQKGVLQVQIEVPCLTSTTYFVL